MSIWDPFWDEFAANPHERFEPAYNEEIMSLAELETFRNKCVRRFYFRPRYIAGRLGKLRSVAELARQSKLGMNLLTGLVRDRFTAS